MKKKRKKKGSIERLFGALLISIPPAAVVQVGGRLLVCPDMQFIVIYPFVDLLYTFPWGCQ